MHNKDTDESISIAPSLDLTIDKEQEEYRPLVSKRVLYLSIQVIFNAIIIGLIAKVLVALISLITNLSFYGKFSIEESSPAHNQLGWLVIFIPVIGGLVVGIMARIGSSAIRGHGIPEAMEQVLTNKSRIKPIITLLKPLSAAISIGTGGPFGAEGPIISTGGAFGSLTGQIMHISPNERKIMLTAGATAGMAAIFGTPVAAVLLAIELLLFEFSPRSIIPVALACATGAAMHYTLFSDAPVFAMPAIPSANAEAMICYVAMGAVVGVIAAFVTKSIYYIEDLFEKLPIHWMWWPAIGSLAVGITGYFAPYTMGVGYSNISQLLSGNISVQLILGLCFLKFISWSISLGSGTSGGTLAPLLTIGGATGLGLGLIVSSLFPQINISLPTCALIGMAAMFAGSARALLTSIVFAFETTLQPHGLLPLLGACTASYFVSFFMMKSSIMTEKINRRGVPTPDAYEPDILRELNVEEVMDKNAPIVREDESIREVLEGSAAKVQDGYGAVILDKDDKVRGAINLKDLYQGVLKGHTTMSELKHEEVFVFPNSTLLAAIILMEERKLELLPVVSRQNKGKVLGVITKDLILSTYRRRREDSDEHQREISIKRSGYKFLARTKRLRQEQSKRFFRGTK
ncbi:chloride channel protein [Chitinophaga filiformis]|uniref:H+/Cl-antiporter ClcA n=1 Tax=Chitinophaga filiformis TaxID=104663 RepID=A0A1G7TRZ9_CHIFI|nr:chloride channel protein [Chitinophaga filiformis]SDG37744.1 H+/Cl-antiporter ClcA [Chitinophaga filiformis]